jgi:hypothetical protein
MNTELSCCFHAEISAKRCHRRKGSQLALSDYLIAGKESAGTNRHPKKSGRSD